MGPASQDPTALSSAVQIPATGNVPGPPSVPICVICG